MDESNHDRMERLEVAAFLKDVRIAELVREIDNLHAKAEHAAVIDQAKGVIMGWLHCGSEAAFAVLVVESQHQNRRLWQIAQELAESQGQQGT